MVLRRIAVVAVFFVCLWHADAGCAAAAGSSTQPATSPAPVSFPLRPFTAFAWQSSIHLPEHVAPLIWMMPTDFPASVELRLRAVPPGLRVLFLYHAPQLLWGNPRDFIPGTRLMGPWATTGVTNCIRYAEHLFSTLKAMRTSVDYFVTDDEIGLDTWETPQKQIDAIAADPRFAPVAARFKLTDVSHARELSNWDVGRRWNAAVASLIASYFRQGYYEPLNRSFPAAGLSEFGDCLLRPQYEDWAKDGNGWSGPVVLPLHGNAESPVFYGQVGQLAWPGRNDGTNPDFKASPLPTMCWTITRLRAYRLSSDYPIVPWVAPRHQQASWQDSPYYEEAVRHVVMNTGQSNLLYFNPEAMIKRAPDDAALGQVMGELATVLHGCGHFAPIGLDRIPYNATTIVSGVRLPDGTRVYRVTFSPGQNHATLTLPEEKTPTRITPMPGDVGAWITRPPKP